MKLLFVLLLLSSVGAYCIGEYYVASILILVTIGLSVHMWRARRGIITKSTKRNLLSGLFSFRKRRDPAAKEWGKDPSKFTPPFEVSVDPVCPYCGESLGKRKPPTRRSKFSCTKCGYLVFCDPKQRVFPTVYLNSKQGLIAEYLGRLDSSPATAGRTEDFWWAAQQNEATAGKFSLSDSLAADTLWALMNYNVVNMEKILPKSEGDLSYYIEELQVWLRDFKEAEKAASKEMKEYEEAKKKGKLDARIDLVCPYCGGKQGKVPKPSKSGARKCKICSRGIVIDPYQSLFPGYFLTERQSFLVQALGRLNHWVFTDGSKAAYNRAKKELGKSDPLSEAEIADILRALIRKNIDKAWEEARRDYAYQKRTYSQAFKDVPPDMKPELDDYNPKRVEGLLEELDSLFK